MTFGTGLFGGLLSGLGKFGSLLGTGGSGLSGGGGVLGGVVSGGGLSFLSPLAGITGALGQYRARNSALNNQRIFGNIRDMYGRSNMARDAGAMVDSMVADYGRSLQSAARAGGVMPNYHSNVLNFGATNWQNYLADQHAMEFNGKQRDYSYRAHRLAHDFELGGALLNTALDLYERRRDARIVRRREHGYE